MRFQNRVFGSRLCNSFRFSWHNFLFPGESDCFDNAFVSDAFIYGTSLGAYFWSDSLTDSGDFWASAEALETAENELPESTEKPAAAVPLSSSIEEPVVLLQLLDGPMYGLTRYWLEGTDLHYVTTYGGQNSVPLVRIDFEKTIQLNAARGVRFDVTKKFPNP